MRVLLAALLLLSALAVATPEAAACHPAMPLEVGPVSAYVDPHGCGPEPFDPAVCASVDGVGGCVL